MKILPRSEHGRLLFVLFSIGAVLVQPGINLIAKTISYNTPADYRDRHTALAGQKWVEENIPAGSRILLYGYYVNLPHLVDSDPQKQAQFGEHFMYFRWKNQFLVQQFLQAHAAYLKSGRVSFSLENIRDNLRNREAQLFTWCLNNKIDYVLSTFDLSRYEEYKTRSIKVFGPPELPFGVPFSIYQVKDK